MVRCNKKPAQAIKGSIAVCYDANQRLRAPLVLVRIAPAAAATNVRYISLLPNDQTTPARRFVARVSGVGALSPTRVPDHAVRTYSGRPRSSIRFSTSAAIATSVA